MINKLRETLSEKKEEYIQLLIELLEIDTQHIDQGIGGGYEAAGQAYLTQLAKAMKASRIIHDPMSERVIEQAIEAYGEGNPGHNYTDRSNLYVEFAKESGPSAKSLMFNGHIDTMPPGDLSLWQVDPFKPVIKDGKLYGLGATDMKAGLLASFLAVKLLKDSQISLPIDVWITSVVDEEGGGNGSIQAALNAPKTDGVIVCEGTDYELILAHMGFAFYRITLEGKAHHSGSKWKGVSAISKMRKIMEALEEVEYAWLFEYKHPLLPPPNLNIGVIQGGSSGATVAGSCSIELCIHYHPETMSFKKVDETIRQAVEQVALSDDWLKEHPAVIEMFQRGGAYEQEEDAPLVRVMKENYYDLFATDLPIVGSPAGCDSRIWKNIAQIPTVQYGPGRLEQCHSPNEYIEVKQYLDAILFYANAILLMGEEENE